MSSQLSAEAQRRGYPGTIEWRGFVLVYRGDDSWSVEDAHVYLGVSCDDPALSNWSALIECGMLNAEGEGRTAVCALEDAREKLREEATNHVRLVAEHFGVDPAGSW